MLKRIVDWFLYTFHLRKRPPGKSGIESLLELLPIILATGLIVGIISKFIPPKLSWHRVSLFRITWFFRKLRLQVIGY